MKNSLVFLSAATACAVALVGCEWGGVHEGESWNDAYSWANFSGTYKLVNEVVADDGSSGEEEASSGPTTVEKKSSKTFKYSETTGQYFSGQANLVPGSVTVSFGRHQFKDNGAKGLVYQGEGDSSGTIDYSTGTFTINLKDAQDPIQGTISYAYYGTEGGGSSGKGQAKEITPPISWLNLTQKGNLLTFRDNDGTTYTGKITGASCPSADESGYITAGHIRFPFEATCTSNSRITLSGSLSGDWSGAQSANTGTLANRTIDATYHTGKSATQLQAVSGSTTVMAKAVGQNEGYTK